MSKDTDTPGRVWRRLGVALAGWLALGSTGAALGAGMSQAWDTKDDEIPVTKGTTAFGIIAIGTMFITMLGGVAILELPSLSSDYGAAILMHLDGFVAKAARLIPAIAHTLSFHSKNIPAQRPHALARLLAFDWLVYVVGMVLFVLLFPLYRRGIYRYLAWDNLKYKLWALALFSGIMTWWIFQTYFVGSEFNRDLLFGVTSLDNTSDTGLVTTLICFSIAPIFTAFGLIILAYKAELLIRTRLL